MIFRDLLKNFGVTLRHAKEFSLFSFFLGIFEIFHELSYLSKMSRNVRSVIH